MEEMDIDYPDFLEQQFETITAYVVLRNRVHIICTLYDRGIENPSGYASWAESNAVAFQTPGQT